MSICYFINPYGSFSSSAIECTKELDREFAKVKDKHVKGYLIVMDEFFARDLMKNNNRKYIINFEKLNVFDYFGWDENKTTTFSWLFNVLNNTGIGRTLMAIIRYDIVHKINVVTIVE